MRRTVAAIVLVIAAFVLAACGGTDTSTTTATPTTPAAAPVAPVVGSATATDTKSPQQVVGNEAFPTATETVPADILDRLRAKQPMIVYFYDSTQLVTKDERVEIDAVMKKYRGLIDFVSYDIRTGLASSDASKDVESRRAMDVAGAVGVKSTPYTLFVDREGRITGRFLGFADRSLLEREVLRATE